MTSVTSVPKKNEADAKQRQNPDIPLMMLVKLSFQLVFAGWNKNYTVGVTFSLIF